MGQLEEPKPAHFGAVQAGNGYVFKWLEKIKIKRTTMFHDMWKLCEIRMSVSIMEVSVPGTWWAVCAGSTVPFTLKRRR